MTQVINNAEGRVFSFQLEGDEEVYSNPLASSLPLSLIRVAMRNADEFAFAIIEKYCPELVERDDVTLETMKAVLTAWDAASAGDGADLGKSRASSKR